MQSSRRLLLLDIVGLTPRLVGADTPNLVAATANGAMTPLQCPFPALTCSAQASLLTGTLPREHGIVGNGWYFRELQEVALWKQSHALLEREDLHGRVLRELPGSTVARWFLWYAMGAPATACVTPRPQYRADGRKLPDIWTSPPELRDQLQAELGQFPLFSFWGPGSGLASSKWIVDAALRTLRTSTPNLLSVYVPHLDYDHQRFGPDDPRSRQAVRDVDRILGPLLSAAHERGYEVIAFSEYGITPVGRVAYPNRRLREAGLLAVRDEGGGELLDPVHSRAFAVADHQIAHVYVRDRKDVARAREVLAADSAIDRVLTRSEMVECALDHPRSGELLAIAAPDAWCAWYTFMDDARAPDFARCVDIHRKPGYDPAELVFDRRKSLPKLRAALKLARKALGFRTVFDLIGLDATVVGGSHGRMPAHTDQGPVLMTSFPLSGTTATPFPIAGFPDLVLSALR